MQANNTTDLSFAEVLDRWKLRQDQEREQLTTDAEKVAHYDNGNAFLSGIIDDLNRLLAEVDSRGDC